MRKPCAALLLVAAASFAGCDDEPTGKELIAAKADLTTRQLIAGLNAKNKVVLGQLLVVTATTGGAPRALTKDELGTLVFPDPPFRYLGAGKPGAMLLRDGRGAKRSVRLIQVGEHMRVLASRTSFAEYVATESGQSGVVAPAGMKTRVIRFMTLEKAKGP